MERKIGGGGQSAAGSAGLSEQRKGKKGSGGSTLPRGHLQTLGAERSFLPAAFSFPALTRRWRPQAGTAVVEGGHRGSGGTWRGSSRSSSQPLPSSRTGNHRHEREPPGTATRPIRAQQSRQIFIRRWPITIAHFTRQPG